MNERNRLVNNVGAFSLFVLSLAILGCENIKIETQQITAGSSILDPDSYHVRSNNPKAIMPGTRIEKSFLQPDKSFDTDLIRPKTKYPPNHPLYGKL